MERSGEAFRNILVDHPLRNLAITHEINFNFRSRANGEET